MRSLQKYTYTADGHAQKLSFTWCVRFSEQTCDSVGGAGKIGGSRIYLGTLISYYTTHQTRCCIGKVYEWSAGGEHEHSPRLTATETVQTWQSSINTMYQLCLLPSTCSARAMNRQTNREKSEAQSLSWFELFILSGTKGKGLVRLTAL